MAKLRNWLERNILKVHTYANKYSQSSSITINSDIISDHVYVESELN